MKLLSDISKNLLTKNEEKIVELIAVIGGWKTLEKPTLSKELACMICSSKEHYTAMVDPVKDQRRVWICANRDCLTTDTKNTFKATTTPIKVKRALEWPKFCEINAIGDVHFNVRFDNLRQSDGKITYMLKFANKPSGIILMQGMPGTGKTYSAMSICELFTRKDTSCVFSTHKQMLTNWMKTFNTNGNYIEGISNYVDKIMNVSLLVVDDFGTAEVSPGFMSFFMDLINTRMQWTNRGTVITTNLDDDKFNNFCGEALADRILTGQRFEFKGISRRINEIL